MKKKPLFLQHAERTFSKIQMWSLDDAGGGLNLGYEDATNEDLRRGVEKIGTIIDVLHRLRAQLDNQIYNRIYTRQEEKR
jgi:hypothetical protein